MAFMPHSWLNSGSFGTVAEAVRQRLGSAYRTDGSRFSRAIASSAGSPRGSSTSWTPSRRDPRFTVTPAARRAAARSLPDAPRSKPTSTSPGTGWPSAAGGGTGVAPAAPGAATARHAITRTASLARKRSMGSARATLLGGRRRAGGESSVAHVSVPRAALGGITGCTVSGADPEVGVLTSESTTAARALRDRAAARVTPWALGALDDPRARQALRDDRGVLLLVDLDLLDDALHPGLRDADVDHRADLELPLELLEPHG